MGKRRGPYDADFPVGSTVRIANREVLERFLPPIWPYHHPLSPDQLALAGQTATVLDVGFYHGGDEVYQLKGLPGTWHEACLEPL
jgi:hypothetical protein